jgi:hypothetical protein
MLVGLWGQGGRGGVLGRGGCGEKSRVEVNKGGVDAVDAIGGQRFF